jgi:hypothetical protein
VFIVTVVSATGVVVASFLPLVTEVGLVISVILDCIVPLFNLSLIVDITFVFVFIVDRFETIGFDEDSSDCIKSVSSIVTVLFT